MTTVPFGLPGADPNLLYADGKPLDTVLETFATNAGAIGGHRQRGRSRQFWSTPPRAFGSKQRDILEVRLGGKKRMNRLRFDIARFPQHYRVEFWDSGTEGWWPVTTKHGHAIDRKVHDSKPGVIASATHHKKGHLHPQHYGPGHWIKEDIEITSIETSRLRWVFTRNVGGSPPIDRHRREVPYSLALRSVAVSYRVRNRDQVPRQHKPITTSVDIFGSPVRYELRENLATDLLVGRAWKSEPQPTPDAVVCLYMNTLNDAGEAEVIDRFYLEPTTSGGSVNIYYSNETPSGDFEARDTPLNSPYITLGGVALPTFAASKGVTFPSQGGFLSLDNRFIEWRPEAAWWMGMVCEPAFGSTDTNTYTLLDSRGLRLSVTQGVFTVTVGTVSVLAVAGTWTAGTQIRLLLSYDGNGQVSLTLDFGTFAPLVETATIAPGDMVGVKTIRIGGDQSVQGGVGNFALRSFVLKESSTPDTAYLSGWADYNTKSEFAEADTHTTDNALIRFSASFIESDYNNYGFVGGAGDRYADLAWTPIQRDFKLVKGYYFIPPTKARYFKFEFTNLTPEPYEVLEPVYRSVLLFPPHLRARVFLATERATTPANAGSPGVVVNQLLAGANLYPDQAQVVKTYFNAVNDERGYTPTEVQVATDLNQAKALTNASYLYRFQAHQGNFHIPRWPLPMVHRYQQVDVLHDKKVAYFVGLSSVKAFRLAYTAADDTEMYLDLFYDDNNIAQRTLAFDSDDLLHTTSSDPVFAQSEVFTSNRAVRAVQFSTTQSPPKQLLPDPDFDDPSLGWWAPVGDASISSSGDYSTWIGTTALVQRGASPGGRNSWRDIERLYPLWGDLEGTTWDDLAGSTEPQQTGGIQSVETYDPAPLGRIYAATRVTAPQTLTAPLWVQVVDASGNVLAEEPANISAGEVAEWYCGYTIGSTGAVEGAAWSDLEGQTWDYYDNQFTWNEMSNVETPTLGSLRARVVQKVSTSDQWNIDNLSLFQDTIVWEFSNDGGKNFYPAFDIRNNPHGVLVFPPIDATADPDEAGNHLVWRVRVADTDIRISSLAIRPWYGGLLSGILPNESINVSGPNMAPYDHYMPITEDPRWRLWHKPIPEEWWFFFRQFFMLPTTPPSERPPRGQGVYLGDPLVLSSGNPPTPIVPIVALDDRLTVVLSP